jgi:hypothetical protein
MVFGIGAEWALIKWVGCFVVQDAVSREMGRYSRNTGGFVQQNYFSEECDRLVNKCYDY